MSRSQIQVLSFNFRSSGKTGLTQRWGKQAELRSQDLPELTALSLCRCWLSAST